MTTKPPHKAIAQLAAIIERLEKWQAKHTQWVEGWRVNGPKADLLEVLRDLEQQRAK